MNLSSFYYSTPASLESSTHTRAIIKAKRSELMKSPIVLSHVDQTKVTSYPKLLIVFSIRDNL